MIGNIKAVLRSWVFWGVLLGFVLIGIFIAGEPVPGAKSKAFTGYGLRLESMDDKATLVIPKAMNRYDDVYSVYSGVNNAFADTGEALRGDFIKQLVFPHQCFQGSVHYEYRDGVRTEEVYPATACNPGKCDLMLFFENNHYFAVEAENRSTLNVLIYELTIEVFRQEEMQYLVFPVAKTWSRDELDGDAGHEVSFDDMCAFWEFEELRKFYERLDPEYREIDEENQVIYVRLHRKADYPKLDYNIMSRSFAKLEMRESAVYITFLDVDEVPLTGASAK